MLCTCTCTSWSDTSEESSDDFQSHHTNLVVVGGVITRHVITFLVYDVALRDATQTIAIHPAASTRLIARAVHSAPVIAWRSRTPGTCSGLLGLKLEIKQHDHFTRSREGYRLHAHCRGLDSRGIPPR